MAQIARALVASLVALLFVFLFAHRPAHAQATDGMGQFLEGLWPDAQRLGVARPVFDSALAGLTPDDSVLAKTQAQPETRKTVGEYLSLVVSAPRIEKGQAMLAQWGDLLTRLEQHYGVDRSTLLGIWGMETDFGGFMGDHSVVRSLATLAHADYRREFFRGELLQALLVLQQGHIAPQDFTGSWAGAFGQTQFMPSSFHRYAVDFDGDGRKNVWTSVPDALASSANYLMQHGWKRGLRWGEEVRCEEPAYAHLGAGTWRAWAAWRQDGCKRADGEPLTEKGEASLSRPAGPEGPSFLVTRNFQTIRSYNNSLAYALGVSLLGARITGAPDLQTPWPAAPRPAE